MTILRTDKDLDQMTNQLSLKGDHLTPYGQIVDNANGQSICIGYLTPCLSVGRKMGIALVRDKDNGHLFLISVILRADFQKEFNNTVNVIQVVLEKSIGIHYDVIASGWNGGRFSFNEIGYHIFGIDQYPICRIWVNQQKQDHTHISFLGTKYALQNINHSKWVSLGHTPLEAENDSYLGIMLGLIPELHARRESHRCKVEAQLYRLN